MLCSRSKHQKTCRSTTRFSYCSRISFLQCPKQISRNGRIPFNEQVKGMRISTVQKRLGLMKQSCATTLSYSRTRPSFQQISTGHFLTKKRAGTPASLTPKQRSTKKSTDLRSKCRAKCCADRFLNSTLTPDWSFLQRW